MDEFRTAAQVLGAVTAGYLLFGELAAGQLDDWFGWRFEGPLSWLSEVIGRIF